MKKRNSLDLIDCLLAINWKINIAIAVISYPILSWMKNMKIAEINLKDPSPCIFIDPFIKPIGYFNEIIPIMFIIMAIASLLRKK